MLIPILFVLEFSLVSAQQKTGAFVGISPLHSGNIILETTDIALGFASHNESIKSGVGLKLGYNFPKSRISFNSYNWNFNSDFKISNRILIYNYVFDSGIYLGVGVGNGTLNYVNGISDTGSAVAYNLGYDFSINERLQIGIGYLRSVFVYTIDNPFGVHTPNAGNVVYGEDAKIDITVGVATLFVDITYRF